MKIYILRWTGILLYLISFLLPAIANPENGRSLPGWACAFFSVWFGAGAIVAHDFTQEGRRFFLSLLLPGLANPLLVFYLVLTLKRRGIRICQALALLVFLFVATTPISIRLMPFHLRAGFYVWLAGLALTVGPDIVVMIRDLRTRRVAETT